jgi:ribosomal protein S21
MDPEYTEIKQRGLYVEVNNNDVNRAMRKLKKMVQAEGLTQTLREREAFQTKGQKRKKARARAIKRWEKKQKSLRDQGIMP